MLQVTNVTPRYAKLRSNDRQVYFFPCLYTILLHNLCAVRSLRKSGARLLFAGSSVTCLLFGFQVIGWENIELISDRPLETMLEEFKRLKHEYPDRFAVSFFRHMRKAERKSMRPTTGHVRQAYHEVMLASHMHTEG